MPAQNIEIEQLFDSVSLSSNWLQIRLGTAQAPDEEKEWSELSFQYCCRYRSTYSTRKSLRATFFVTAEEKLLISQPAASSVMNVPAAPFCIEGEKANLYNAMVEIHFVNDEIDYGKLHSICNENEELHYVSSKSFREAQSKFSNIRFVLFTAELEYQLKEHPLQDKSDAVRKPELPQSFDISFLDGRKSSGDSAISVIADASLHIFKVKSGNVANRMFIPLTSVERYVIGEQIGTLLKAANEVSEDDLEKGLQKQEEDRGRPLGEYLKEQGVVSDADLQRTLKQQKDWPKLRLGELLIAVFGIKCPTRDEREYHHRRRPGRDQTGWS